MASAREAGVEVGRECGNPEWLGCFELGCAPFFARTPTVPFPVPVPRIAMTTIEAIPSILIAAVGWILGLRLRACKPKHVLRPRVLAQVSSI